MTIDRPDMPVQPHALPATPHSLSPIVLVVDDEPTITRMLRLALGTHGLQVMTAGGGHEAVRIFRLHGDRIRLVLLDVRMPGMDGPETLLALRAIDPKIPCWFMTGDSGKYTPEHLAALGASKLLMKPISLVDTLAELKAKLIESV